MTEFGFNHSRTEFACKCGTVISLIFHPNQNSGKLIWDSDFEPWQEKRGEEIINFIEAFSKNKKKEYVRKFYKSIKLDNIKLEYVIEDIMSETDAYSLTTVSCNECKRIYIEKKSGENEYQSYIPE